MRQECYDCHLTTIERLIEKFDPPAQLSEQLIFLVRNMLSESKHEPNPVVSTRLHRIARHLLKNSNLYATEKLSANLLLMSNYEYWKGQVQNSPDPFYTAAKLSVIGNIIDYGARTVNGNIKDQINALYKQDLTLNMWHELKYEVSKARSVLFLGDNSGEIVFDKLFIETMGHPEVIYVVRGEAVINDVTLEDAEQVGMDQICQVISNGFDAPSTIIEESSDEMKVAFRRADLVISKGQGNFEGLMNSLHPNIFFMLIAKCESIAELLGVKKGSMVITQKKEYVV
jgi:damage-control phosphatase, subfamily I